MNSANELFFASCCLRNWSFKKIRLDSFIQNGVPATVGPLIKTNLTLNCGEGSAGSNGKNHNFFKMRFVEVFCESLFVTIHIYIDFVFAACALHVNACVFLPIQFIRSHRILVFCLPFASDPYWPFADLWPRKVEKSAYLRSLTHAHNVSVQRCGTQSDPSAPDVY